jgi:hypothetical protein
MIDIRFILDKQIATRSIAKYTHLLIFPAYNDNKKKGIANKPE